MSNLDTPEVDEIVRLFEYDLSLGRDPLGIDSSASQYWHQLREERDEGFANSVWYPAYDEFKANNPEWFHYNEESV